MSANLPSVFMVAGKVEYTQFQMETIDEDILAVSGGLSFFMEDDTQAPLKYWSVYGYMEGGGIVSVITTKQTYFVNIISRDPDYRIVLDTVYTNVHAELDWDGTPTVVYNELFISPYVINNSIIITYGVNYSIIDAVTDGPASIVSFDSGIVYLRLDDPSVDFAEGNLTITLTHPGSAFPEQLTTRWQSFRYDTPEAESMVWWAGKAGGAPIPTDLDANPVYVANISGGSFLNGGEPGSWIYNPDAPSMNVIIKRLVGNPLLRTSSLAHSVVQPGDEALDDGVAVIESLAIPGQIPFPPRYDSPFSFQVRNDFPTPVGEPAYRFDIDCKPIPFAYRVPPGYTGPVSVRIGHASDYEFVGIIQGVRQSDTLTLAGADGDVTSGSGSSFIGHPVYIKPYTSVLGLQEIVITVSGAGIGDNTLRLYSQRVLPRETRKFDDAAIDLPPFLPYEMRCIGVCNALGLGMSLPNVEEKS